MTGFVFAIAQNPDFFAVVLPAAGALVGAVVTSILHYVFGGV